MSPAHFTFIDLENIPDVDLSLLEGQPVHTTILIGAKQKKLELEMVQQIHRLGSRVELVEVGASGRNALDLTLACYLGRALERAPQASFSVVSKDRDFDPMIAHLRSRGVVIARHGGIHVVGPAAPRPVAADLPRPAAPSRRGGAGHAAVERLAPDEDRTARITARLGNPANRNRPTRRRGLLAQIRSSLGKHATEADAAALVQQLEVLGVLAIDAKDRVSYRSR